MQYTVQCTACSHPQLSQPGLIHGLPLSELLLHLLIRLAAQVLHSHDVVSLHVASCVLGVA